MAPAVGAETGMHSAEAIESCLGEIMKAHSVVRLTFFAAAAAAVLPAQSDGPFTLNGVRWTSQQAFIDSGRPVRNEATR